MNSEYLPTIGLEIHAELKTRSKMFCGCLNDQDEKRPNVNVCPICMGHPGTLPVPNKEAIKHVLKMGLAGGGEFADFSEFDRKNYFYPDIPKGYQISQYKYPFIKGGKIKGIAITRIHLEEDTAKSTHETEGASLVDYNRSSLPLMELVTEPVIHSGEEAAAFARELQLILRYLDASDANMEKGQMRVEANISVSKDKSGDPKKFGTKVEVKNLNSFKSAERAIAYEIERHIALLASGGTIVQETRGFDENTGKTFSQRTKEDSHDYRYFPEPDIPKIFFSKIPEFLPEALRKEMPELPEAKRARYAEEFKMKPEDIEIFVQDPKRAKLFEDAFAIAKDSAQLLSNYILSDLAGLQKANAVDDFGKVTAEPLSEIIALINAGKVSSRGAKDILAIVFKDGGSPERIAEEKGWILKNDPEALKLELQKIISENQSVIAEYKAGKEAALNALVGKAMKATGGSYSPQTIKDTLISLI